MLIIIAMINYFNCYCTHHPQLAQAALETVVPKELGAAVLVVEGKLRGNKARVQAKTAEACAVSDTLCVTRSTNCFKNG